MANIIVDKLIKEVATKFNLKISEADRIITSQFKFLCNEMQTGNFETIMLHHLGKFTVSEKKKRFWAKKLLETPTHDQGIEDSK